MSKEELLDAYKEGRITRRDLVKRLAAAGGTLGAALLLTGGVAGAQGQSDEHKKSTGRKKSTG